LRPLANVRCSLCSSRTWAIYKDGVYDLSDYTTTLTAKTTDQEKETFGFLDTSITSLFSNQNGMDITKKMEGAFAAMNETQASQQYTCLRNAFYRGDVDFRESPACTVNNYILLSFSILIMLTIGVKCRSLLLLTSIPQSSTS
jgi:chitin synthase